MTLTYKWLIEGGAEKEIDLHNFQKSDYTVNIEGLATYGVEKPEDISDTDFQTRSGLDASRSKALKEASTHEGKFDAVNSYDKAKISFGFIQFAGTNLSFEYLMALLKYEKSSIFHEYFGKYGLDVEFMTDNKDKIKKNSCRIVVHSPKNNSTYRGLEAEDYMSNNPLYAGIFVRAGANSDVQNIQLKVAKEKYVDTPDVGRVGGKIKAIIVEVGGIGGPATIEGATAISDYKKTENYTTNNANGHITEIDLNLSSLKFGDIMQSDKERAAL